MLQVLSKVRAPQNRLDNAGRSVTIPAKSMSSSLTTSEEQQLLQTIEMFKVITQSQPQDVQSLEILKEAYFKLSLQREVVDTSKRIAEAYVQLGQLSSAIMEYETILQRNPDDADVQNALAEIEHKTSSFATRPAAVEPIGQTGTGDKGGRSSSKQQAAVSTEVDDGWQAMQKIFVDGKIISSTDFGRSWFTPPSDYVGGVVDPFIQRLADQALHPLEKSLKLLCEKSRLSFLPLDRYDVDMELARSFPRAVCQKWCILPFDRLSKSVLVATANPFNKQAALELQAGTPNRLLWYLASPVDLTKTIKKVR